MLRGLLSEALAAVVELFAAARAHKDEMCSPMEDQLLHILEHILAFGALGML